MKTRWLNVSLLFSLFLWPFYAAPPIAWQSPSEVPVNRVISTGGQAEVLPARPLVDASSPVSPDYDLLVLAPEEFRPPLDALVAHKVRTGLPATLLTLEALYDDPRSSRRPTRLNRSRKPSPTMSSTMPSSTSCWPATLTGFPFAG